MTPRARRWFAVVLAGIVLTASQVVPAEGSSRRVVSLTATPSTLEVGRTTSLTGRLRGAQGAVHVVAQRLTAAGWRSTSSVRADRAGRYRATMRPAATGQRRVRVVASDRRGRVVSPSLLMTVRAPRAVTVEDAPTTVVSGTVATVRGVVARGAAGHRVDLETRTSSGWRVADTTVLDRHQGFALRATIETTTGYRVRVPATTGLRAVATGGATITARPAPTDPADVEVGGRLDHDTTWTSPTISRVRLGQDLEVPRGVTLTVGPGVTVLAQGHRVVVRGRLVSGQGGVTTWGHTLEDDAPGSWPGLLVGDGGDAQLGRSLVRASVTALDVDAESSATWHGAVRATRVGLSAASFVDATDVDWGSTSGPAPYGDGAPVRGVTARVVPWRGHAPSSATVTALDQGRPPCADVRFVGIRGSGEGPRDGDYERDVYGGLGALSYFSLAVTRQHLEASEPTLSSVTTPLRYEASTWPDGDGAGWRGVERSVREGAAGVVAVVRDTIERCPASVVVVSGQSQGAMVARRAVARLAPQERATVAAMVLWGDPTRSADGPETTWQAPGTPFAGALRGLLRMSDLETEAENDLPADLAARVLSMCRPDDGFCSARVGSNLEGHLSYTSEDVMAAGEWIARRVREGRRTREAAVERGVSGSGR